MREKTSSNVFSVVLKPDLRLALLGLSAASQRKPADYLRFLIREDARRAGLLVSDTTATAPQLSEVNNVHA